VPGRGYHYPMTRTRKLAYTAALFLAAVVLVGVSAATRSAGPLFAMWIPLHAVPWLLARPEPEDREPEEAPG